MIKIVKLMNKSIEKIGDAEEEDEYTKPSDSLKEY